MGLAGWLVKAASSMGIKQPTPIQSACIKPTLSGRDIIGCAQTGSGKTAAFALPILHKLSEDPYGVFAVVLTPSRELAFQIAEQFSAFGAPMGARIVTVTGGTDMVAQSLALSKQPHIIVATPGRLAHQLSQSADPPDLSLAAFLVLDECDRLMDASFKPDMDIILAAMSNPEKQTLLYSATITADVRKLGESSLHNRPLTYDPTQALRTSEAASRLAGKKRGRSDSNGGNEDDDDDAEASASSASAAASAGLLAPLTVSTLTQEYLFIPSQVKYAYLWQLLLKIGPADLSLDSKIGSHGNNGRGKDKGRKNGGSKAVSAAEAAAASAQDDGSSERARSIIVFVSTCRAAQLVCEMCIELGIPAVALHSLLPQQQRLASLAKFKGSIVRLLVATDVASRGLDIPVVDLVVNFDVPRVPSDYVHRVGRTARAGRVGRAVTLVTQYEVELLQAIEDSVLRGKKLAALPEPVCPEKEVLARLTKVAAAVQLAKSRLEEKGFDEKAAIAKERKRESREARDRSAAGK